MADPWLSRWPLDNSRHVTKAEAQVVDRYQGVFKIAFVDSTGRQHAVQIPLSALENLAETASALIEQNS